MNMKRSRFAPTTGQLLACSVAVAFLLDVNDSAPTDNADSAAPHRTLRGGSTVQVDDASFTTTSLILAKATKRALGGGIPGAIAGVVQVLSLMWLRTVINYQCRYGTNFTQAMKTLYKEDGVRRFYRGLGFALFQAPMSRFVSTASNDGTQYLLANLALTQNWGPAVTTLVAAVIVGIIRMSLMPIDTMKTVLQVDSTEGYQNLMQRVGEGKLGVLYQGAVANAISSSASHYPWFLTYNILSTSKQLHHFLPRDLLRNALIGLVASMVSDTVVNAARVVKTTKQSVATKRDMSYAEIIRMIVAADGWKGLFGRGLRTRIVANAVQSILFTVMWRGLVDYFQRQ